MLREMRNLIRVGAPDATETISYAIPTFDQWGRHLVHFAGYEHHVGFYPTSSGIERFKAELTRYKSARGSVRFPLNEPLPSELIGRMVRYRVEEETERARPRRPRRGGVSP
jgi:uncharacterized protein YdhG (YjbR/CyaY superfamily)